jgi:hypothetical protein
MWCKHLNKEIKVGKNFESECDKCAADSKRKKTMYNEYEDEDDFDAILDEYTIKDQFIYEYETSKKQMMVIIMNRPEAYDSREVIINSTELDEKMEYYKNNFDDDLVNKKNDNVFIEKYIFI